MTLLVLDRTTEMLRLSDHPIASGMSREIHALPGERELVVKVLKPRPPARRFFRKIAVLRAARTLYKKVVPLRREIREYSRVSAEGDLTAKHLQKFSGLVRTNKGWGLIVKAVKRNDGSLALTLNDVVEKGIYNEKSDAALREFLRWFVSSRLVAADVHLNNIVLSEKDGCFVLVDGIGDKTFLPVRAWVPALNHRHKVKLASAIYADVAKRYMMLSLNKHYLVFALVVGGAVLGIDLMDGHLIDG